MLNTTQERCPECGTAPGHTHTGSACSVCQECGSTVGLHFDGCSRFRLGPSGSTPYPEVSDADAA